MFEAYSFEETYYLFVNNKFAFLHNKGKKHTKYMSQPGVNNKAKIGVNKTYFDNHNQNK